MYLEEKKNDYIVAMHEMKYILGVTRCPVIYERQRGTLDIVRIHNNPLAIIYSACKVRISIILGCTLMKTADTYYIFLCTLEVPVNIWILYLPPATPLLMELPVGLYCVGHLSK